MKIIHCADLHLDSKMKSNLDSEKARVRRGEILHTFERMVDYALQNGVEAILIAGDLFDTAKISRTTLHTVLSKIEGNPSIHFYILRGNHDRDHFLTELESIPENLFLFGQQWKVYEEAQGKIAIWGLELSADNSAAATYSLLPDPDRFNIVMLHGQEAEYHGKDRVEMIHLRELRGKGIDYLALGHIHAYKKEALDPRGTYCYPGCLEGRGFDECGEHGFVLLNIDEETGTYQHSFIPFAGRKLYCPEIDLTGCMTSPDMARRIEETLQKYAYDQKSLLKVVLTGALDVECEKNLEYLLTAIEPHYFFVKIEDNTSFQMEEQNYLLDESLKGEFVRQVMADDTIPEEEKEIVIRYGLLALAGEEVQ